MTRNRNISVNDRTMDLIIPILPKYAAAIYEGVKTVELRKTVPKIATKQINRIFLYETKEVGLVTGFVTIDSIISGKPCEIWEKTVNHVGINKSVFDEYFLGRRKAYALEINSSHRIIPRGIKNFGLKSHPQSFVYLGQINLTCQCCSLRKLNSKEGKI